MSRSRKRSKGTALAFYLSSQWGQIFFLHYPESSAEARRRAVIHVPAFAEEMNKSRRMTALLGRKLAAQGIGVLVIDLPGTGDSSGEFGEATWNSWCESVLLAREWLEQNGYSRISLWGLRTGGCVSLAAASGSELAWERFDWVQPVGRGSVFLSQFLRLRVAEKMFSGNKAARETGEELKSMLERGETLEIAGYDLSPDIYEGLNQFNAANLSPKLFRRVSLYDIRTNEAGKPSPAVSRLADKWKLEGVDCHVDVLQGEPFWITQEISVCEPLVLAMSKAYMEQST